MVRDAPPAGDASARSRCTPDSAGNVKPEHDASAARPWPSVENRRLRRPFCLKCILFDQSLGFDQGHVTAAESEMLPAVPPLFVRNQGLSISVTAAPTGPGRPGRPLRGCRPPGNGARGARFSRCAVGMD
jgi:hypothetical protein